MSSQASCLCGEPGFILCACTSPPTSFCPHCLATHVFTVPGRHQQSLCSLKCHQCRNQPAACLCFCAKLPLCTDCFERHQTAGSRHIKLPLSCARVKGPALDTVEALLEGVEEAKNAQLEVVRTLNGFIKQVHAYKLDLVRRTTEDINLLQRTVNSAVKDLAQAISQPNSLVREDLQALITLPAKERTSKLEFTTLINSDGKELLLSVKKCINLIISKQLVVSTQPDAPVQYIPLLEHRHVYISPAPFDSAYEAQITDFNDFLDFTAWCFIPNGNLVITGTQDERVTMSIDCAGSYAVPLADTMEVHWMPGIIRVAARVYLFGGLNGHESNVCEMYDLYENHWILLPDMKSPRSCFQPCQFSHYIYLIGGRQTAYSERFNLQRICFEPIRLQLPSFGWTVTFCTEEGLFVLLIGGDVYTWDQHSSPQKLNEDLGMIFYSQMSPVQVGREVYFHSRRDNLNNSRLMRFDLECMRLVEAVKYDA